MSIRSTPRLPGQVGGIRAAIHPEWFAVGLRGASPAWRLLHLEEAAECGELDDREAGLAKSLEKGWSTDAVELVQAAFWTAEAIWRHGLVSDRLTLAKTQRARQIGTALLGPKRMGASPDPQEAAWHAAGLFAPSERSMIRLQLSPRASPSVATEQTLGDISSAKAQRLVAFACDAMQMRVQGGSHG